MRFLKYSRALYLHAYLTGYFDAAIVAITRVSSVRAFPYTAVHCLIHRRDGIGPILQVKITQLFGWLRNRDDCTRRSAVSSNLHSVTIIQTDRRPDRILYGIGAVASQANFQIRFYRKRDFARKVCTLRFRLIPT